MLRKTIRVDRESDPAAIIESLRTACGKARLTGDLTAQVLTELREALDAAIRRGNEVAAAGGQFRAIRTLNSDAYEIKLAIEFGLPAPGVLSRIARLIGFGKG